MKKHLILIVAFMTAIVIPSCNLKYNKQIMPSDKLATPELINLYKNLNILRKEGIMFGQQDALAYGVGWKAESDNFICDVSLVSGQFPAVFGWDLGNIGNAYNIDSVSFIQMAYWIKEIHRRGGINVFSWHQKNLVSGGSSWDLTPTVKQILPGGSQNKHFISELEDVAAFFNILRDDNGELIPIIFRPFHEFEGNWFWWSQSLADNDEYIQLWRFTIDFFRSKNIHNILYCYNPDFKNDITSASYYPGDSYVDLIGIDEYNLESRNQIILTDQKIEKLIKFCKERHKIPCISEAGDNTIPQQKWWTENLLPILIRRELSYVLIWRNANANHYFAPYPGQKSVPDFVNFINQPEVLTLDDLSRLVHF